MLTFFYEHSNLCNINLCNVTHFLITQNPMDRMFVVESYSLLSQVFLPYICGFVIRTTIEVNPYPRIVPCVCTRSVFFFFFFFFWCQFCHLLNCWCMDLSHCSESQVGGWHVKMDHVLWYHRFSQYVLNPNHEPCLMPLTCDAHL